MVLQLSHSRRKNSSSWHLGDETCNSPSNNYPHKSSTPRQRASAHWNNWYDISKARNTLVFVLNRAKWFKKVFWKLLVRVTQIGPAIRQYARELRDIIAMQRLRKRTAGARRTLQGTSLRRCSSSRDGFRLGKTHSTAQGTRRTQTHRNTMLGNTTVGTRETSIRKSSGHEEQHRRSLHETSGWVANTVACEEAWASNPGWYKWYEQGSLRHGDDWELSNKRLQSSRGVSILSFNSWQNAHYTDVASVHWHRSFPVVYSFFQLVHRQTQFNCTIHSLTSVHAHLDRTGFWVNCLCRNKCNHTVILKSNKMDQITWQTLSTFDLIHSSHMWIQTIMSCGKHSTTMQIRIV